MSDVRSTTGKSQTRAELYVVIRAALDEGYTIREIAERICRHHGWVYGIVKEFEDET